MHAGAHQPTEIIDSDLPWDLADPARSEFRLGYMLEDLARDRGGAARTIEVRTQLARAQGMQGKLVEAERSLTEAEAALRTVTDLRPRVRCLLERGRLHVERRTPREAGNYFLDVWRLTRDSGETYFEIDAAQMLSVIETPKKKIVWTLRALALAEASEDARVRAWCGPLHVELGWHFAEQMQFPRALECFQTAVARFETEGGSRQASMARCAMGRILRLLHREEEALAVQLEVRKELEEFGADVGTVFEEIGECLHALDRGEAEVYFERAHELLSKQKWIVDNEPARLARLRTLGKRKRP